MDQLRPLWQALPAIAGRLRSSRRLLLASDYDGTLVDIVPRPERAVLPLRTRRALRRLSRLPCARVAILSGRRIDDLESQLRLGGLWLAGTVGLETQDADGRRRNHVPHGRGVPLELREKLTLWCARFEGAWVEDKVIALAVHYRQVPEALERRLVSGVKARSRAFGDRVRLIEGKKVVEVLPPSPWNKAAVLARWSAPAGELIIFLGDDVHDEPVHQLVRDQGGITVAVGRERSHAEFLLDTPEQVTWWLEWLSGEWAEGQRRARRRLVGPEARKRASG